MSYTILAVSDSNKHFQTPIDEYLKRLGKSTNLVDLKPHKHGSRDQIIEKETTDLRKKLEIYKSKGFRVVLLVKEGKSLTTEQLHKKYVHTDTVFVIGWPYGVDEALISDLISDRISFGAHTMPHGLAKLVILEQIYRIQMIEQGRQYHY